MSDDTPPWENKPAKQEALYIHWCMHEGCNKWQAYSFKAVTDKLSDRPLIGECTFLK